MLFGFSQRGALKKQKSSTGVREVVKAVGERWLLLSDDSQKEALGALPYPQRLHFVRLTEVVRCTPRIALGAGRRLGPGIMAASGDSIMSESAVASVCTACQMTRLCHRLSCG